MSLKWKGLELPRRVEWDGKTLTPTYGKLIVEVLERGYGVTIGNNFRRVLLSSIRGAAVTSMRIEGVLHEFGTIPGVLEDVTDVVISLKQLSIKLHGEDPSILRIKACGEKEVVAADIITDDRVEILNPHLHIATLNSGFNLQMEMVASPGKGYVPAEKNKSADQPIGVIPIDSIYSPVKKVNFRVENSRLGQEADYDRLIMEVWTNGAISPQEAIVEGADIMRKHFAIFVSPEDEIEKVKVDEISEDEHLRQKHLDMSVSELELSVRAAKCLEIAGIKTVEDLVQKTRKEMLQYKNFGKKSVEGLEEILTEMGLSFRDGENET
ncbi:MAG: DNA-directed RNA polymerase subunit alpha [Syntrophomonadaceae bacterium]|nr:DNA-directed RNA polymerase subunit alpha [Bacillota bacterium]MBT9146850.1 DNA-directed RNA polymerase subunit alpha [Bacillota bacterium]